jgi:hypothetical protein
MSFSVTHLVGFGAGGAEPPTLSYQTTTESGTDTTTYTFAGTAIGAESAARYVVVATAGVAGAGLINSVTLGGNGMTEVVTVIGGAAMRGGIYILAVPTGTTASIVVTFANTQNRCGLAVWALYGLNSATAVDTATATAEGAGSLNLDTQDGGIVVAYGQLNSSGQTMAWTGVTADAEQTGENVKWSASASNVTAATPRTVSTNITPDNGNAQVYMAASFR